jgi:hypothetical protein
LNIGTTPESMAGPENVGVLAFARCEDWSVVAYAVHLQYVDYEGVTRDAYQTVQRQANHGGVAVAASTPVLFSVPAETVIALSAEGLTASPNPQITQ